MPGRFPSLDGQQLMATDPGFDAQPQPVSYWVDGLLAAVGADRMIDPEEGREIQRLMAGLTAIAQQKQAAMGMNQPPAPASNETSDFGSTDGSEDVPEFGAQPGAEFTTRM